MQREVNQVKESIQEDKAENKELSAALKKRKVTFRIIGIALIVVGLILCFTPVLILGVLMMIGGVAMIAVSSPKSYSDTVDGINMLAPPAGATLDSIYEAFKDYETIYGSVYKGTTWPKCPSLFWSDLDEGWIFYIYMNKSGLIYVGSGLPVGCKKLSEPLHPEVPHESPDFQDAICFNLERNNFVEDITEVLRNYFKTGVILPMPEYQKGDVYFFEESFKMMGQRFTLYNAAKEPVYNVEGNVPLINLRVYDQAGSEIFKVSKEILHALPYYKFYQNGEYLGEFSKKLDLARDAFTMDMPEGKLEMLQNNLLAGSNYLIKLNGKRIGMIAEKLNLTFENIVFDNMVFTVYDQKYLPLITALGVMAAREMARDEDTSLNN